jgi:hypothetical protein
VGHSCHRQHPSPNRDRGPWAVGRDRDRDRDRGTAELGDQVRKTEVVRGKPLTRITAVALSEGEQEN